MTCQTVQLDYDGIGWYCTVSLPSTPGWGANVRVDASVIKVKVCIMLCVFERKAFDAVIYANTKG